MKIIIEFFHKSLRQLAAMASLPFSTLRGGWGEMFWRSGYVFLVKSWENESDLVFR